MSCDGVARELQRQRTQLSPPEGGCPAATDSPWNQAPVRLWKRVSVFIRPDIHDAARKHDENFTRFLNNVLARKYGLPLCPDDRFRKARRLRHLRETTVELEHEIAALSAELRDDRLGPEIRDEMEREHARVLAVRDNQMQDEADAASRAGCIRASLDAFIGEGSLSRYERMLPENDPSGDRADAFDELVALVARRCRTVVDPSEVVAEVRRRAARAKAGEGP